MNGPINLNERINPTINSPWPPQLNSFVMAQNANIKETFIGKVIKKIWNDTAVILLLLNHQDYEERILDTQNIVQGRPNGKGLFLLLPIYGWRTIDKLQLSKLIGDVKQINESLNVINPLVKKYIKEPVNNYDSSEFKSNDLLTSPRNLDLDDTRTLEIQFNDNAIFNAPDSELMKLLKRKLEKFETPDIDIVINKNIALNNLIKAREDEINEGNRIIKWVKNNLINKNNIRINPFKDLKIKIQNGYVFFARKGIRTTDTIERHRVPKLKRLSWQYGKPINYQLLKHSLFLNKKQLTIQDDLEIQKESKKILSQEYLIAIHPDPKYQIWMLKRFIMAWFADVDLQNNVRMVKILINQFRINPTKDYNIKNGILPSIVIYPRYGVNSSRIVLTKINYYFSLYTNHGIVDSIPTYFVKLNNLIYYTNGSLDLKLYFRKMMEDYNYLIDNTVFTKNFVAFEGHQDDII